MHKGRYKTMKQSIKAITDILSACGCNPETITKSNGETLIKVNAPVINKEDQKKCK